MNTGCKLFNAPTVEYFSDPSMVQLQPGDVLNRPQDGLCVVVRVSEGNSRVNGLAAASTKKVQLGDRVVEFKDRGWTDNIARFVPPTLLVARLGPAGVADFMAGKLDRTRFMNPQLKTKIAGGSKQTFAPGNHPVARPRGGLAADMQRQADAIPELVKQAVEPKPKKAGKPLLFGHSICAVLRSAGAAGLDEPQVRVFLARHGVVAADATIKINLKLGASGKAAGAPLTAGQVAEMKGAAK